MSEFEVEGEVLAEEDAELQDAAGPVRVLQRYEEASPPALRNEARTAVIAAAGGALAGVATVAAVRAVGSGKRSGKRLSRRRERPANVVASRSFLVDVHLLGR